jgi:hypothetical protein
MAKSNKNTVTSRVNDVLRLLLAGAEFADIRQYAADHGWNVSERQVRRYMEVAHRYFAEATERDREQLLGRHLMQRRALYARALKENDLRTALQVLRDEAALQNLYPPTKIAPTTPDGENSYQPQQAYQLAVQELTTEELRIMVKLKQKVACIEQKRNVIDGHVRRSDSIDD